MAEQCKEERERLSVDPMAVNPTASNLQSKESEESSEGAKPPQLYIPACGVLCDAFWWASGKTK
jgi:hypothetical protein